MVAMDPTKMVALVLLLFIVSKIMKKIIAVGTTSKQKIDYLKEVLKELKVEAEIVPIQAESKISNQPKSTKETKQGSINRAREAFKKIKSDFGIGIEMHLAHEPQPDDPNVQTHDLAPSGFR